MKMPVELSKVLDRGGSPTVRDLLSSLFFDPSDGTIRLQGDRVIMQRAAHAVELRRELIRLLGATEARAFLIRLGFLCGRADARFVRAHWPNLDASDAFTAGTRLHTFSGVVRVETVFNAYDFRRKRFSAEFVWHDSVEAAEYRNGRHSADAVCWTQIGYASGYASEFFDTLIVYKEVECAAQGHSHCRVVGKPADIWGASDPEVILFREHVIATPPAATLATGTAVAQRKPTTPAQPAAPSRLDQLMLAPVREELERLAGIAFPVLITGEAGTGRSRAARCLHAASGQADGDVRRMAGAAIDRAFCADITRQRKAARGTAPETIVIEALETTPAAMQPVLAAAIEEGLSAGGPRIVALLEHPGSIATSGLCYPLQSALSALTIRMPSFAERPDDRLALARELLATLAARMGIEPPELEDAAARTIEQADWPGNIRQMRGVLIRLLTQARGGTTIRAAQVDIELQRFPKPAPAAGLSGDPQLDLLMQRDIEEGRFSLSEFEQSAYRIALERAGGNLSAAARLLGLTRAQFAYRVSGKNAQ